MDKEKQEEFSKDMAEFTFVTVMDVRDVNHKPFPYCVGPKHVAHASDHHGGMLGDDTINTLPSDTPKGYRGPPVYLRDITFDKVAFLQLTRDATNDEIRTIAPTLERWATDIDGVAFVETKEGYRIT